MPALGFAPRPYDRFALVEDEETTGLTGTQEFFRADKLIERGSERKGSCVFGGSGAACKRLTFTVGPLQ